LLLSAAAFLVVAGVGTAAYVVIAQPFKGGRADLLTHKVRFGRLPITIVERGALESANNRDIVCRVKARAQGTQNSTTIKWVIDDGSHVLGDRPLDQVLSILTWEPKSSSWIEKPGSPNGVARVVAVEDKETGRTVYADVLVDLDDSGLIEQLKTQKITQDQAESSKIQTEEAYKITLSQNESDLQTKRTTLELALIDLEKYQKGDFPQSLKDVEGRIKIAESDLEQQRDRAAWAQRMLKKGYYTVSQSDSEQSKLQSLQLSLDKVMEERRVLTDPTYGLKKRTETDYKNKVAQAKDELDRAMAQARAKEVQARTDRDTKKSLYDQESSKYKEIEDEIRKCKLYAPQEGLVVYYVAEQTRWGVGRQSVVAQGEMVTENQKLMQIPDLKHMFVNTKVHEALVSRVHKGQPAFVRVDAMANRRLKGHVDAVANTASQQDFFAADVKVYATKVAIDEEVDDLKPGMTSEVTITIADALEHVLTIPIEAIIGSAEMGKTRKCFVMTPHGPEERDVLVGMNNDKEVEIRDGLKEGEEVVLNPRVLAGEKAKIHQPGEDKHAAEEAGEKSGRKGKGGPKGGREGAGGPNGESGIQPGGGMEKIRPPRDKAGQKGNGFQPTAEQMQNMKKQMVDRFKGMTPAQRKEALEKIPEEWRENARQTLKESKIEVPD
jgi:HlyD family secretion protein